MLTAYKDEGAVNSFLSIKTAKEMGLTDQMKPLSEGETITFTSMGGSEVPCVGKIANLPLQVGSIDTKVKLMYVTPENHI